MLIIETLYQCAFIGALVCGPVLYYYLSSNKLLLNNGEKVEVNAPTAKVTEKYALSVAYHWAKVSKDMVISVVGIK